jgi:hypothetical protein
MCKKLFHFLSFQRAAGILLFSALYFATPHAAFAQDGSDLDLEAELAAEPEMNTLAEPSTSDPITEIQSDSFSTENTVEPIPAAQSYSSSSAGRGDTIIVERMKDPTLPYKQRRNPWGVLFSVNYEQFTPENYYSLILNQDYKTFSGDKSIPLIGAEFGVKYNFSMGSLSALVGYSQGTIDNTAAGLDKITASITKAGVNFALDNLMDEPYVVPYGQIGIHSIDWSENSVVSNVTTEESFSTDWNFHYKVGLSFQLNWIEKSIDPSSQEDSLRSGLENTYIDMFYTSYAQPSQVAEVNGAEGEADLQSSQIGAGLKLEF